MDKIDWTPTGGLGHFPTIGLNRLIDEIGITTDLIYDSNGYSVNFDNLSRELRNGIPDMLWKKRNVMTQLKH